MNNCKVNKGKHTFSTLMPEPDTRIGPNKMFHVKLWHTCIACGERRGITAWGELIKKIKGEWQVVEP